LGRRQKCTQKRFRWFLMSFFSFLDRPSLTI
jgi:hypothetical protein